MANFFPELDELLDDGAGRARARGGRRSRTRPKSLQPGLGAAMDQLDFMELYNKNEAVPDECVIPFIPFRFHIFAAATTMTRAEFVAFQTAKAKDLRSAILADDDAPPARCSRWPPTSRPGSTCTWRRWKTPSCCAPTARRRRSARSSTSSA